MVLSRGVTWPVLHFILFIFLLLKKIIFLNCEKGCIIFTDLTIFKHALQWN